MTPTEPQSAAEYMRLFNENMRVDGFGLEVTTHAPCPFCAAPDWAQWHPAWGVVDSQPTMDDQLREERTCSNCGRSAKHIVERTPGSVTTELVQTGGPDPPEWLTPTPRRVP